MSLKLDFEILIKRIFRLKKSLLRERQRDLQIITRTEARERRFLQRRITLGG